MVLSSNNKMKCVIFLYMFMHGKFALLFHRWLLQKFFFAKASTATGNYFKKYSFCLELYYFNSIRCLNFHIRIGLLKKMTALWM